MRRVAPVELGGRGSFMASARYAREPLAPANRDPIAEAYQAGKAEGRRLAEDAMQSQAHDAASAERAIELAFARFDEDSARLLQERLRAAVVAICQAMAGEIAIDPERLASRVGIAANLLRRTHDGRIVRLNPEDLTLVRGRVDPALTIEPDPDLARGELRIDAGDGGIEDGAQQWRAALDEALGTCAP